ARRPRLHGLHRPEGPRLLRLRLQPHPRGRAVRVRVVEAGAVVDRRGPRPSGRAVPDSAALPAPEGLHPRLPRAAGHPRREGGTMRSALAIAALAAAVAASSALGAGTASSGCPQGLIDYGGAKARVYCGPAKATVRLG